MRERDRDEGLKQELQGTKKLPGTSSSKLMNSVSLSSQAEQHVTFDKQNIINHYQLMSK